VVASLTRHHRPIRNTSRRIRNLCWEQLPTKTRSLQLALSGTQRRRSNPRLKTTDQARDSTRDTEPAMSLVHKPYGLAWVRLLNLRLVIGAPLCTRVNCRVQRTRVLTRVTENKKTSLITWCICVSSLEI